ncbi:MAG: LptF/LptG family permease, partial [candidate division Zixibacteria bacterium]|nr:LptF/LptG family permease [candidate division Zixibacteria bacterium]
DSLAWHKEGEMTDSAAYEEIRANASAFARKVERGKRQILAQRKTANKYNIEIHKKYSIPAASLAFVILGAPLAVLSRRGGMGLAIAISIFLFIVYWAFLIGGEDLADRGLMSPFWAMWGANVLMGVLGLYLLYVVVSEKPVLAYFRRKK